MNYSPEKSSLKGLEFTQKGTIGWVGLDKTQMLTCVHLTGEGGFTYEWK